MRTPQFTASQARARAFAISVLTVAVAIGGAGRASGAAVETFTGRVYDLTRGFDAGIPGAAVALRLAGTDPGTTAVTDEHGKYVFTYAVDDDDWIFFEATADGFYPVQSHGFHGSDLRGGGALNFGLQPRNDVEVRVHVYDAGAGPSMGVAGARVGFWQADTRYDLLTDADGRVSFTLTLPDSESFPIWVSADGYYTSLTNNLGGELRRTGSLEVALQAAPPRVVTEITGLVYDAAGGRDASLAGAEVFYSYYGGGVYPDVDGVVRAGADGRYRIDLPLGPSDGVSLRAEAVGFGSLSGAIGVADAQAGVPVDFGLPALGGVVRVEPGALSLRCHTDFTVTITNDGPPGEVLTIVGLSFNFSYGEGVYGQDFVWDLSGIEFPAFLASGEQLSFPMSFGGGPASRVVVGVLSGARSGYGAAYYGDGAGCGACRGDCDGDGTVTIGELVRGVALALDAGAATACPSLDADENAAVSVAELVTAIDHALNGCDAAAAE